MSSEMVDTASDSKNGLNTLCTTSLYVQLYYHDDNFLKTNGYHK